MRNRQLFIGKIRKIVLDNLEDEDFGIKQFCKELNYSRSQVHNYIKAATGVSTSIFIREMRLERATQLLMETNDNISEIAYQVGFKDPFLFFKTFY